MSVTTRTTLTCFTLLTISCCAYEFHEVTAFNSGWIPSTKENIFHLLRINNDPEPITIVPPAIYTRSAMHVMNNDVIKFVRPNTEEPLHQWNNEAEGIDDDMQDIVYPEEKNADQFYPTEYKTEEHNTIKNKSPNTRKAKGITEHIISNRNNMAKVNSNYLSGEKENIIKDEEENVINKENRRTYEVTEALIRNENTGNESTIGYIYNPPEYKEIARDKGNLTNILLGILSKHNINEDDYLPNYDLSRRNKSLNPTKEQIAYFPLKFNVPYSYNNLNHLPVNPLMAVLLSNYGYYLPGLYGIQRNYNNLYGYLASNNMHNNKPFGEYKIFSDTDSSN